MTASTIDRTLVRVECSCKVCAMNAEKFGWTLPLVAEAPQCWFDSLVRCSPKLSAKKVTHSAVYLAHDPSTIAGWARDRSGVKAL
jgi:hypothetical protein